MSIGVTIKAFGYVSSLLGTRSVVLSCDNPLSVRSILDQLKAKYPSFSNYVGQLNDIEESLLILRDGNTEDLDSMINPGDELILVTPISGG